MPAADEVSVSVTHHSVDTICPLGYNEFFGVTIINIFRFYIY